MKSAAPLPVDRGTGKGRARAGLGGLLDLDGFDRRRAAAALLERRADEGEFLVGEIGDHG
jgi:hypothetical protein